MGNACCNSVSPPQEIFKDGHEKIQLKLSQTPKHKQKQSIQITPGEKGLDLLKDLPQKEVACTDSTDTSCTTIARCPEGLEIEMDGKFLKRMEFPLIFKNGQQREVLTISHNVTDKTTKINFMDVEKTFKFQWLDGTDQPINLIVQKDNLRLKVQVSYDAVFNKFHVEINDDSYYKLLLHIPFEAQIQIEPLTTKLSVNGVNILDNMENSMELTFEVMQEKISQATENEEFVSGLTIEDNQSSSEITNLLLDQLQSLNIPKSGLKQLKLSGFGSSCAPLYPSIFERLTLKAYCGSLDSLNVSYMGELPLEDRLTLLQVASQILIYREADLTHLNLKAFNASKQSLQAKYRQNQSYNSDHNNGTKKQIDKLFSTSGITDNLFSFMQPREHLQLQSLRQSFYQSVGQSQPKIPLQNSRLYAKQIEILENMSLEIDESKLISINLAYNPGWWRRERTIGIKFLNLIFSSDNSCLEELYLQGNYFSSEMTEELTGRLAQSREVLKTLRIINLSHSANFDTMEAVNNLSDVLKGARKLELCDISAQRGIKRHLVISVDSGKRQRVSRSGSYTVAAGRQRMPVLIKSNDLSRITDSFVPVGLRNSKNMNTCFINSILQPLLATPYLNDYFLRKFPIERHQNQTTLARAFADMLVACRFASGQPYNPTQIQNAVQEQFGQGQHDSQEFMRFIIERMHDELNRVTNKPAYRELKFLNMSIQQQSEEWNRYYKARNNSVMTDLFEGQLINRTQCLSCGLQESAFDSFMDLSLGLPRETMSSIQLSDCLQKFISPERNITKYCSACRREVNIEKDLSIYRFPKILTIHFKRFQQIGQKRDKLTTKVQFPETLDVSSYAPHSTHYSKRNATQYQLYGITHHKGSLDKGHYNSEVYNQGDNQWYDCNDQKVKQIRQPDTASSSAYILFYVMNQQITDAEAAAEAERERLEMEKAFKASRLAEEIAKKKLLETQKAERSRIEVQKKANRERLEAEKNERARIEAEQKGQKERQEAKPARQLSSAEAKTKSENTQAVEAARLYRETQQKAAKERTEAQKVERLQSQAEEKAAKERAEAEQAQIRQREAIQQAEQERLAADKAKAETAEKERLQAEQDAKIYKEAEEAKRVRLFTEAKAKREQLAALQAQRQASEASEKERLEVEEQESFAKMSAQQDEATTTHTSDSLRWRCWQCKSIQASDEKCKTQTCNKAMNEYHGDIMEIIVPNAEEPASPNAQPAVLYPSMRNKLHYTDHSQMSTSFSENVASGTAEECKEPPFILEEQKEKVTERPMEEISYDRLTVSADKNTQGKEVADHLLSEQQFIQDKKVTITSKANFKSNSQMIITIDVDKPVKLVRYALKSANDCDTRDPKQWEFVAVNTITGQRQIIHKMNSKDPKFILRWWWNQWNVNPSFPANRFLLKIKTNHGDRNTQLGQLKLFELGQQVPEVPMRAMRTVVCPIEIVAEFLKLAKPNTTKNVETCAILAGNEIDGQLVITTLIVPTQTGKSDQCAVSDEMELFETQTAEDLITIGWIHSHPKFDLFLSSVDIHTQLGYQKQLPEAVGIVYSPIVPNPGYQALRIKDSCIKQIETCKKKGFHEHKCADGAVAWTYCKHINYVSGHQIRVLDIRKR